MVSGDSRKGVLGIAFFFDVLLGVDLPCSSCLFLYHALCSFTELLAGAELPCDVFSSFLTGVELLFYYVAGFLVWSRAPVCCGIFAAFFSCS